MTAAGVGLSFRAEVDPQRIERLASAAARYGFPALSVWDDLGDPPPFPLLHALAERDKTANLGFACLAVPKYPSLDGVVGMATALAAMREGPVFIGLTSGAWLSQTGLQPGSVGQVGEAAAVLKYLFAGQTIGFQGSHYNLAPGFRLNFDLPREPPSLMIGGWGKRMLHLAGEMADEVKVGGSAAPEMAALARERIEPGARAAGRDPADIGLVLGAVTIVDDDRNAAIEAARRRAATYIPVIGALDPGAQAAFPDAIAAVGEAMQRGDLDAAMRAIPDALLRRFAFAGTPDDVIRQVEVVFAAGATRVDFGSPHGLDPVTGIELIGSRVLPYFRK
jgi:5,10-methylenetetrahydromethanopterin reductase